MQRYGFIHDMLDVKVLILYVAARSKYPMTMQQIYELAYVDDCLSYFDVCTAVPEMVQSGHLCKLDDERYEITEKGKTDGELMESDLVFSVKQKAQDMVELFNRQSRRGGYVKSSYTEKEDGAFVVTMSLDDEMGSLMKLELTAPSQRQAIRLSRMFEKKAEQLYSLTMSELLDAEGELG